MNWLAKIKLQEHIASKGKGLTIPWTGKIGKRHRANTAHSYDDDIPHNLRIFWQSKNKTKLDNRDKKRMGIEDE